MELVVVVSVKSLTLEPRWQRLVVPLGDDSGVIQFILTPLVVGLQTIEIEFYHHTQRIGYILAQTEVIEEAPVGQDDQYVLEQVNVAPALAPQERPDWNVIVTQFDFDRGSSVLSFLLIGKRWVDARAGGQTIIKGDVAHIKTYIDQITDLINTCAQTEGRTDAVRESILLQLKGIGASLYQAILPPGLGAFAADWPSGAVVSVSTNDRWVPWELMYDGNAFWGEKFVINRVPRYDDTSGSELASNGRGRHCAASLTKIVNVMGGNLPPTSLPPMQQLFTSFVPPAHVTALSRPTLSDLIQALPADIVHLTCHGHSKPDRMLQLGDTPGDIARRIDKFSINQLPDLPGAIVFCNACTSAVPDQTLGELGSFAWDFYLKHVCAYIGSLGVIPTEYAVVFAQHFYDALRAKKPIGEALFETKQKSPHDTPYWLLYVLYGDPFVTLPVEP